MTGKEFYQFYRSKVEPGLAYRTLISRELHISIADLRRLEHSDKELLPSLQKRFEEKKAGILEQIELCEQSKNKINGFLRKKRAMETEI